MQRAIVAQSRERSSLPVGRGVLRLDRRVAGQEATEIAGQETDEIINGSLGSESGEHEGVFTRRIHRTGEPK